MKLLGIPLALFLAFLVAKPGATSSVREYPTPLIREEQTVLLNGKPEIWRLQWAKPPIAYCEANEGDFNCPCEGFSYGEIGELFIVRLRDGREIDRLPLTKLFDQTDGAAIQRWPTDGHDLELSKRDDFARLVSKRPTSRVMHFADFDHDGQSTEFFLQTASEPCGKITGVVVGISAKNNRLHVFSSVAKPGKPLVLFKREWQALLTNTTGQTHVVDWTCDDHGADSQTELTLRWFAGVIGGDRLEYECSDKGVTRHLIKKEPI